jgi:phosphocarrier protein
MMPIRRHVPIVNALGLHLRAADKFVRLAQTFRAEIRIHFGGASANGKIIMDLMSLAAASGATLDIGVSGTDAGRALAALCGLIQSQFHEAIPNGARVQSPGSLVQGR